jgi:shikimate dehydrogenase
MKLGLLGKTLGHSFSPAYFKEKFDQLGISGASYLPFESATISKELLHQLIIAENLDGFNVTIPYKESIITLLDELSKEALEIGAVNTVEVNWSDEHNFSIKGYNTDWTGFLKAIRPFLTVHHQKALILGTGGASKAIAYALKSLGIDFFFVSRSKDAAQSNCLLYNELNKFAMEHFKLIINTSPLGTVPDTETFPAIPYEYIGKEHLLCDLVYNPAETTFMKKGKHYGATVMNGLSMLQFQADDAWQIWNNKKGHSV